MKHVQRLFALELVSLVVGLGALPAAAHDGSHASVHDTVAALIQRMRSQWTDEQLLELTVPKVEAFLTAEERQILGTEHIHFRVNVPVVLTILRDTSLGDEPFWLRERGFAVTGLQVKLSSREFDAWEKAFGAGEVGLGIHNLTGHGTHYLVLLRPQRSGDVVRVTELYPGHLRTASLVAGAEPFVDQAVRLSTVPLALEGQVLVRTDSDSEEDARLVNLFSKTKYPAATHPDQIVLTWSGDPRTTQTIQWRTSGRIKSGVIRYWPKMAAPSNSGSPGPSVNKGNQVRSKHAMSSLLSTPTLLNDPTIYYHTVVLNGLKPGTTYEYCAGDGSSEGWTSPAQFTTAPAGMVPFSFIYMGDAQNGLERWGVLLHKAFASRPDAAFYLMAGDLVDRGAERWDWDSFFENSKDVFDRRQLVPVLGNHEYQGGAPKLYHSLFTLPRNGPATIPSQRAYSFEYSNAKFIVLDSNLDPTKQTAWLEKQLANTKSVWRIVSYHHPAYSSGGNRDNPEVRNFWTPLFDKYQVDLALQGHDHAYLRTYPMRGQQRVASAKDGTIYIISVSGTKHYEQKPHDYTEVGFTKLSTYQVLDIQVSGNRLVYRAHDVDGKVKDEFVLQK